MTSQEERAPHFSAGFGARTAVYCIAALFFVVSVQSLFTRYRLFLFLENDLTWPQALRLLAYPGLLIAIVVGLPLLRKWAWALAIVLSLISGIMGLVAVWFRPEEWPWVVALNTPSRVAWLAVSAVTDLGIVIVLLLKPVRALFFRRSQPHATVSEASGV
jgi:hypothetical protein